jgi:hypothetical protein
VAAQGHVVTWRRGQGATVNRRGWHDEWRVTGRNDLSEAYDQTWSSLDPSWPDGYAEVAARTFVQTVIEDETSPPWKVPPTLRHRRVFTGQWEDVDVKPRPAWRRPATPQRQGASS